MWVTLSGTIRPILHNITPYYTKLHQASHYIQIHWAVSTKPVVNNWLYFFTITLNFFWSLANCNLLIMFFSFVSLHIVYYYICTSMFICLYVNFNDALVYINFLFSINIYLSGVFFIFGSSFAFFFLFLCEKNVYMQAQTLYYILLEIHKRDHMHFRYHGNISTVFISFCA